MTNTLTWILVVYAFTVAISYPFIKSALRKVDDDESIFFVFTREFLGKLASFIPFYNLYLGFFGFLEWLAVKKIHRMIKKIASKQPPEVKAEFNKVLDSLKDLNKLD
jgi:hypothetical protein